MILVEIWRSSAARIKSVIGTLKAGCWWHISGCAIRVERFLRLAEFGRTCPNWGTLIGYCVVLSWVMTSSTFPERPCSIGCTQRLFRQIHSGVGQDLLEQLEIVRDLLQRELFDEARTSYGTDAESFTLL